MTRTIPNKEINTFFTQNVSDNNKSYSYYTAQAPKLHENDLKWLSSSEDITDDAKPYRKRKQVLLKRDRGTRIIRCKQRAKNDLGLEIPF